MSVFKLRNHVQNYAWGKTGEASMVARLMRSEDPDFGVDDKETYAELWMGTHPSGPSMIQDLELNGQSLSSWLDSHPEVLGPKDCGSQLPYLLKVLSVQKALSIQAHPDKSHAEILFKQQPEKYPDSNHKPEMAIALTPFEALCGFRPFNQIQDFVRDIPELRSAIGESGAELLFLPEQKEPRQSLKHCFTALMEGSRHEELLSQLQQRLGKSGGLEEEVRSLFLRLHAQFPGDVGCFGAFFFNFIVLQPGEAIYLAANEPHAYLSGDCVECMACSDNVVRAGLTPKWKDVTTLCQMLTYNMKPKAENLFTPTVDPDDPCFTHYLPPVKDFAVTKIQIPTNCSTETLTLEGGSLLLTTEGAGRYRHGQQEGQLKSGSVLFLSASAKVKLEAQETMTLFQAYAQ